MRSVPVEIVESIAPVVVCTVRESRGGADDDPPVVLAVDEDDDTPDEAEALRRVQEMLGATPVEE